jgi:hypothetical protein
MPSRDLVQFYEDSFGSEGLAHVALRGRHQRPEQERRRAGGKRTQLKRAIPGDASEFIKDPSRVAR